MTDRKNPLLESQAKQLLDKSARELDDTTVARLRAARARAWQRAAATPPAPVRRPRPRWWLPVGSVALAGVTVAVVGALWFATPAGAPLTGIEDIELLASKETPEFYAELEFYQWLASRVDAG
ncbi:MAG: hypothetical protein HY083_10425 [Gammaproteobacteria bacterium]|nr:hypothetical protein [Gammaproteobacteria bacterium]